MKRLAFVSLVLFISLGPLLAQPEAEEPADFVLVVNTANDVAEMERSKISKMFRKKIRSWPNDLPVVPVDQNEKSEVRTAFSQAIHNKTVAAIKTFWQRMIFSGRDSPPTEVQSDQEVVEFVRRQPGAIGYVSSDFEFGQGIKQLKVTD